MAFVGEVTLPAPWRDTDVQIHSLESTVIERQSAQGPFAEHDPVATVPIGSEGTLIFDAIGSYVVVGADDWALRYSAVTGGDEGDDITVTYVDPAANDEPLAVAVVDTAIEVTLGTGEAGAITSTADDIAAEIAATPAADALVAVTNEGDSDGSDVAEAVAETSLTGGSDGLGPGRYVAVAQDPDDDWRYVAFKVNAA